MTSSARARSLRPKAAGLHTRGRHLPWHLERPTAPLQGTADARCDTGLTVARLYYMPRTRSSRVLWLLAEIGAPYELVKMAPKDRSSAEHLARHPLGRVPALELDDGTVMFESAAICLQLADLHPDSGLIEPLQSAERALIYQWVLFAMTEIEAPLYRWIRDTAENSSDASARERFAAAAAAIETALSGRDWLVADHFSVADVVCASVLGSAHSRGLLGEWPGLQAYVERGEARPAFIEAAAISNQPRE
jgi:glutathione S-transferase